MQNIFVFLIVFHLFYLPLMFTVNDVIEEKVCDKHWYLNIRTLFQKQLSRLKFWVS